MYLIKHHFIKCEFVNHGTISECHCNTKGTLLGTSCARLGGKCTCKAGVGGRDCDLCMAGFYNFTDAGCERTC